MEALKCLICGTRHWPRQECPAMAEAIAEERKQLARKTLDSVTKPHHTTVTKPPEIPVTIPVAKLVTEPVTKSTGVTKPADVTKPKGGRPLLGDKPMTAAERMRKYRQRLKEARP